METEFYQVILFSDQDADDFKHILKAARWCEFGGNLIVEEEILDDVIAGIKVLKRYEPDFCPDDIQFLKTSNLSERTKYRIMENYYYSYPFRNGKLDERIDRILNEEKKEIGKDKDTFRRVAGLAKEIICIWNENIKEKDITPNKQFSVEMETKKINKLKEITDMWPPL